MIKRLNKHKILPSAHTTLDRSDAGPARLKSAKGGANDACTSYIRSSAKSARPRQEGPIDVDNRRSQTSWLHGEHNIVVEYDRTPELMEQRLIASHL